MRIATKQFTIPVAESSEGEVLIFTKSQSQSPQAVHIFEVVHIFEAIIARAFSSSPLRSASVFDKWVHVVGLKKEVTEANKIMNLSFFPNYGLIKGGVAKCPFFQFLFTSIFSFFF